MLSASIPTPRLLFDNTASNHHSTDRHIFVDLERLAANVLHVVLSPCAPQYSDSVPHFQEQRIVLEYDCVLERAVRFAFESSLRRGSATASRNFEPDETK